MEGQTRKDLAAGARRFVRACESGALATHSKRYPGYPFGSMVAFALDRDACPVMLVSRLAEHSHNLESDPRASLLVRRTSRDSQADARVTLVAQASVHNPGPVLFERCLKQIPGARELLQLGDFFFILLEPVAIRYIGGFGAIHWIEPGYYAPPPSEIPDAEPRLLSAIASELTTEVRELGRRGLGHEPTELELIGLDCDGLDLRADGVRLRFDFQQPVLKSGHALHAVAALVEARP